MSTQAANDNAFRFLRQIVRKIFIEDWPLKLIALAITFGLWFAVTGLSTPTKERFTVPLNLIISSNAQITNTPPAEIQIELSGDKRKFDQINRGDLTASIDLTSIAPGDWVVNLQPENISVSPLPQGIKVADVVPGRIPIKLEAVAERDLEVKQQTVGEVVSGYEVYMTSIVPPWIKVRGPASLVRELDSVVTDKIDLAGHREDFTARQVPVYSPNPQVAVLNTVVDVFFRIGEKRMERFFTIPVLSAPGRTASFSIYGPKTPLLKLRSEELRVDLVMSGNGDLSPQVVLPPELSDVAEIRKLKLN
jgi:hypothetical protein